MCIARDRSETAWSICLSARRVGGWDFEPSLWALLSFSILSRSWFWTRRCGPSPRWLSLARGPPQPPVHLVAPAGGLVVGGVGLQQTAVVQARWLPLLVVSVTSAPRLVQEQRRDLGDGVQHYSCPLDDLLAFGDDSWVIGLWCGLFC